jgi:hypothetical protein
MPLGSYAWSGGTGAGGRWLGYSSPIKQKPADDCCETQCFVVSIAKRIAICNSP